MLCISWTYMLPKWAQMICGLILLILTVLVNIKIEDEFKKKLLKVNFEQIIFKDRFSSAGGSRNESGTKAGSTSDTNDSITLQIPSKDQAMLALNES